MSDAEQRTEGLLPPQTQTQTDLLHVDQQGLLVVLPLDGELAGVGELVTGQLHRHLEAVGVLVAEVVHACGDRNQRHNRAPPTAGFASNLRPDSLPGTVCQAPPLMMLLCCWKSS